MIGLSRGLHRVVQRLLPGPFRARHGAAMAAVFEEALQAARRRGRFAAVLFVVRDLLDVAVAAARLRRDAHRGPGVVRGVRGVAGVAVEAARSFRTLRRSPGFAVVAVATLGLGVGAATAIWTVADGVLFRPLLHHEPDRLVMVFSTSTEMVGARLPVSYPNYADLRADPRAGFTDLAAYTWPRPATVVVDGTPEALRAVPVAGQLFDLLGNRAARGRTLREGDGAPGSPDVVLLSDGVWRTRFGADPAMVGRVLSLDGRPHEVVGVMPPRFAFPWNDVELWIPLREEGPALDRDTNYLQVVGRLGAGLSFEAAAGRADAAMARLVEAYSENVGKGIALVSRHEFVVGRTRPLMRLLLGAAGLLLVLACANLANLVLARGAVRGRDLAVRAALGAGRLRLVSGVVAEMLGLALIGGALGLLIARVLTDGLLLLAPPSLPRRLDIAVDLRTVGFATVATIGSSILFGLLPALRASATDPGSALREGTRGTGAGRRHRVLRGLVVAQLALALVLVTAGALLAASLGRLLDVDPGFETEGVYTFRTVLPPARYAESTQLHAFYDALLVEVARLPGVQSVGATWALPFSNEFASGRITVEGDPRPRGEERSIGIIPVRGDYFETLRLERVAGRGFVPTDGATAPPVVLVNETAARQLWPGEDAVGKRLRRGRADETELPWITVIGVVRDARRSSLQDEPGPEMYWNHVQAGAWARDLYVVVRSADARALARPLRAAVSRLDPELPLTSAGPLADRVAASIAEPRFRTTLLGVFAGLALLLALVGTYGVMAFVVAQRRHEIGVRMAMGADAPRVLRAVLADALRLIAAATVLGVGGAMLAARALAGFLFGVAPLDPRVHGAAVLLLATAALLACWLPARAASRLDPISTLRD